MSGAVTAPEGNERLREYIAKRLLTLIPVLLGVSVFVFLLVRLIPGDPAEVMLGEKATPESIRNFRERNGLDEPIYVQYLLWLGRLAQGDLGESLSTGSPIFEELMARFPNTVELTVTSLIIGAIVGVGLGVFAAIHKNSWLDYGGTVVSLAGLSVPIFWLGLMLIFFLSVNLRWFPTGGRMSYGTTIQSVTGLPVLDSLLTGNWRGFLELLKYLTLPTVTLALPVIGVVARMTRSSMLEVLAQDYIRTARSKGLAERLVVYRHALRNALLPVVTVLGLSFGWLLGGAVVTESVFAWPGLGRYVVQSIHSRDYPAIQANVLFIATVFVLVNLVVDVLYAYINPRIRYD